MALLTTEETKSRIVEEIKRSKDSLQIVSAFCKTDTVKNLIDANIQNNLSTKKLLVRFRLADLLAKASDIDLYDYCKLAGWEMYIRFDLHAKTYIFDKKRCIVGSSNLTGRGFGFGIVGNCELSDFVNIDEEDNSKIDLLFDNSLKVDDALFFKMKDEYEKSKLLLTPDSNLVNKHWSNDVYEQFIPNYKVLFSYDFPNTLQPALDDVSSLEFLDCPYPVSENTIKEYFVRSNCYLWLKKVLSENNNCLYFGALSQLLHNTLFNDPKPYRKDVKVYLANLLSWVQYFNIEEIQIDQPSFSQRVVLNKK